MTHYLNGAEVLTYERHSDALRQLVRESKYKKWPNFGDLPEGELLLQDHGNRVSFRNIRVKPIKKEAQ